MGWWTQSKEGQSFADGSTLLWGDSVADLMEAALAKVVIQFMREQGRHPTKAEIRAGLEFSLGGHDGEVVQ